MYKTNVIQHKTYVERESKQNKQYSTKTDGFVEAKNDRWLGMGLPSV